MATKKIFARFARQKLASRPGILKTFFQLLSCTLHNENVIFSAPWSDRQQAKKTDVTDGRTSKAVELASYALNSMYRKDFKSAEKAREGRRRVRKVKRKVKKENLPEHTKQR